MIDFRLPIRVFSTETILISLSSGEEFGKYYLIVAMDDVDRWLAADEPEGLTMPWDILNVGEIGVI